MKMTEYLILFVLMVVAVVVAGWASGALKKTT